jgi:hypothetical protein
MSSSLPTQLKGDKIKNAISRFSELLEHHPEKSRKAILDEVVIKYDLSPLECEFLHKHFSDARKAE